MHVTNRGALMKALIVGLAHTIAMPSALMNAMRAASAPPSPFQSGTTPRRSRGGWGEGKKRYHVVTKDGKRVAIGAGSERPAQPWLPNVPGMRYEHGQLIPRDAVTIQPSRKKSKKAKPSKPATRLPSRKSGGYMRHDAKGAARAARRAGIISPRQQRKIHRGWRERAKVLAQPTIERQAVPA